MAFFCLFQNHFVTSYLNNNQYILNRNYLLCIIKQRTVLQFGTDLKSLPIFCFEYYYILNSTFQINY